MQCLLLLSADEAQTMLLSTMLITSAQFTVVSASTCEQGYQMLFNHAEQFNGMVVNFTKSLNDVKPFFQSRRTAVELDSNRVALRAR
jgi:hypothetical protein